MTYLMAWKRLRNDLYCVERDVKTTTHSIKQQPLVGEMPFLSPSIQCESTYVTLD